MSYISRLRRFTRRRFCGAVATGLALSRPAAAFADPDYSLVVVPDPQYLASQCANGYNALMHWIVNNQALSVGGSALNIKGVISVGDCVNDSTQSGQKSAMVTAWGILDSNGFPAMIIPGNHDYNGGIASITRSSLGSHFSSGGAFDAATRAGKSLWGQALPGSGGFAYWGGAYDTSGANTYIRLAIGTRKILIIGLEFFARSAVLNWARGIHDAYPDHEVIITTHGYMNDMGEQVPRGTGNNHNLYGPDLYDPGDNSMKAAPGSNSGPEMWGGSPASPAWLGFTTWSNLKIIVSGHWIYSATHTDGTNAPWYWQRVPIVSSSTNKQTVQQIFYNEQELDDNTGHCGGGTPDGTGDTAHLFVLKFKPSTGKLEAYAISTNSGKWTGGIGTNPVASPVQLFSVPYDNFTGLTRGGLSTR